MLEIRPFKQEDLDAIIAIEKKVFSTPWSPEAFLSFSLASAFWVRVAIEGEKIVGYCVAQVVGEEAELHNIAVAPEEQRKGVGHFLLDSFLKQAKQIGIVSVFLLVRPSNQAAIHLYKSFQFALLESRPRYYEDTKEDALVFCKNILN